MTAQLPTTYLTAQRDDNTTTAPFTTPFIISRIATPSNPIPSPSPDADLQQQQRGRKRLRLEDILLTSTGTITKPSSPSKPARTLGPAGGGPRRSTDSSLETFRGRPRHRSTSSPVTPSTSAASTPLSRALSLSLSRRGTPATEHRSSEHGQQQQQQQQPLPGTVRFLRVVQIERGRRATRERESGIGRGTGRGWGSERGSEAASPVPGHATAISPCRGMGKEDEERVGRRRRRRRRRRRSQSPSRSRSPAQGPAASAVGEGLLAGPVGNGSGRGMRRRRRQRTRSRGREHGAGVGAGVGLLAGVGGDVGGVGCGSGRNWSGGTICSSAVDGADGG